MKTLAGVACVSTNRIADDIRTIQERLAQANIKGVANRLPDFPAPPIVATNLNDWIMHTGSGSDCVLTKESKAIIHAAKALPRPNPILVYVPSLRGTSVTHLLNGVATVPYCFTNSVDQPYLGNAFISAIIIPESPFTPIHELGHILGIDYHSNRATNVMHDPSSENTVTGTKRLTPEEIDIIRGNVK
jgi:hypothetical protein